MSSAAVNALLSHRAVVALLAFVVVYALLTLVERVWRAVTRKGVDVRAPRRERIVLSRTHELIGVAGGVMLTIAAAGLAVAGS